MFAAYSSLISNCCARTFEYSIYILRFLLPNDYTTNPIFLQTKRARHARPDIYLFYQSQILLPFEHADNAAVDLLHRDLLLFYRLEHCGVLNLEV